MGDLPGVIELVGHSATGPTGPTQLLGRIKTELNCDARSGHTESHGLIPGEVPGATAARSTDLAIAVGSSLAVPPAASQCDLAIAQGAQLVILNAEPTDYDPVASLVIQERIGPTLAAVSRALGLPMP